MDLNKIRIDNHMIGKVYLPHHHRMLFDMNMQE